MEVLKFNTITPSKTSFLQKLYEPENSWEQLAEYCDFILKGQMNKINHYVFNNLVFNLMNQNPGKLCKTIEDIMTKQVNELLEWILDLVNSKSLTVNDFMMRYETHMKSINDLKSSLWYLNRNIIGTNDTKYLVSRWNSIFHDILIRHQYQHDGKDKQLFELLISHLDGDKLDFESLLPVFKMYLYYKDFFPDMEPFLESTGSNQLFVKQMILYIHDNLNMLIDNKNKDTIKRNILNIIELASSFKEKDIFYQYYQAYLEERLLGSFDMETEKLVIQKFKRVQSLSTENNIIQTMQYRIEDIETSLINKDTYDNLNVKIDPAKHKNLDISKINRRKVNPRTLRFYAWNDCKSSDVVSYNVPIELEIYIDIYNAYYKKKYEFRELVWNFDLGTAEVKAKFGDKTYTIKLATSQLFLLMQFTEQPKMSARELANRMNISLQKLQPLLNTFLKGKILMRDTSSKTNPDMMIWYNHNFNHHQSEFSLVSLLKKQENEKTDEIVKDNFACGRKNIVKAVIVHTMKQRNKLVYEELLAIVEHQCKLPFKPSEDLIKECLEICIRSKFIGKNDNVYEYLELSNDSDSEDEDSDCEDDDE